MKHNRNKTIKIALLVFILTLLGAGLFMSNKGSYKAPVEAKIEVEDIRNREDVRKRIELAEKAIVLEAKRADEVKRHEAEMVRLESELEAVRGAELSLN